MSKDKNLKYWNNFINYTECFLFYCVYGWIYESIYCLVVYHRFINRGFLFGPWLPIYGIGFFIILGIFTLLKIKKPILVFVFGTIIATLAELIASYILGATMGYQLWSYEGYLLNFDSRIALFPSLMFGLLIWIAICIIHPAVGKVQDKLRNNKIHSICFIVITMLFLIDLISRIWLGSNFI